MLTFGLGRVNVSNHISLPPIAASTQSGPPYFTFTPSDLSATIGSTLFLSCQAHGSPTPQITWMFNGHPLLLFGSGDNVVVHDNGTLVITELTRSDLGSYTCTALNALGQAQVMATVTEATQTGLMNTYKYLYTSFYPEDLL